MIRKFFIRGFIFTMILCIPLFFLAIAFDGKVSQSIEDKPFWVFNKNHEVYDYAIGGSSRAYNNADVRTMDSVLQMKGINIAFSGSALAENYLTLYLFLQKGNKIKNYILQLDDWSLVHPDSSFSYPFHEYYFFPYMNDAEVCRIMRENKPLIKYLIWKYLPFAKYAEFNNIFPLERSFKKVPAVFDKRMGTELFIEKHKNAESMNAPSRITHHRVYRDNLKYLAKIVELCRKENINLVFYTAPVYYKFFASLQREECRTCIDSVYQNSKVPYLDFTSHRDFRNEDLMYNETHLNTAGTFIFSKVLADSLNKYLVK